MVGPGNVAVERQRLVLDAFGSRCHAFAGDGGLIKTAGQAFEQAHTKTSFQDIEPTKGCRVIDVERLGRTGQASFALNRENQPQFVPVIHVVWGSTSCACSHASAVSKIPMSNAQMPILFLWAEAVATGGDTNPRKDLP